MWCAQRAAHDVCRAMQCTLHHGRFGGGGHSNLGGCNCGNRHGRFDRGARSLALALAAAPLALARWGSSCWCCGCRGCRGCSRCDSCSWHCRCRGRLVGTPLRLDRGALLRGQLRPQQLELGLETRGLAGLAGHGRVRRNRGALLRGDVASRHAAFSLYCVSAHVSAVGVGPTVRVSAARARDAVVADFASVSAACSDFTSSSSVVSTVVS